MGDGIWVGQLGWLSKVNGWMLCYHKVGVAGQVV